MLKTPSINTWSPTQTTYDMLFLEYEIHVQFGKKLVVFQLAVPLLQLSPTLNGLGYLLETATSSIFI